jgi:hypothetical protein
MNEFLLVITQGAGFMPEWITLDSYDGTVTPGNSQQVNYTIDLSALPEDNYMGNISFVSNDPSKPEVIVPVQLNIGGVAVAAPLADVLVNEGFGTRTINFTGVFIDGNGDALTFSTGTSNSAIATGSINTTTLTVAEHSTGTVTVSLRAEDDDDHVAFEDFTFRINDIPNLVNEVADISIVKGFATSTLDVSGVFTDTDTQDQLTLSILNSNDAAVTANLSAGVITFTEVAPGTSTVTLTVNDGSGGITQEIFTFTVEKIAQTITFAALADVLNGADPITLTATASSGLPVSFTVVSGPATVSGNTLTLTGDVGTVLLSATQAGNSDFAPATAVERTLVVNQDPILSTDDALNASVDTYPVPSSDFVMIKTGTNKINQLLVIDSFGRTLHSVAPHQNEYQLDVRSYPQGVFIVKITSGKGLVTRKIQVIK